MKGGLPFELLLGFRYLRSRGQRTNLSLFVWIGLGGVFLGERLSGPQFGGMLLIFAGLLAIDGRLLPHRRAAV